MAPRGRVRLEKRWPAGRFGGFHRGIVIRTHVLVKMFGIAGRASDLWEKETEF